MLKTALLFTCLTVSLGANAAIVSLDSSFGTDTITRDTATGLDWLDVTVTRGLSYNQVDAQLGSNGDYAGYRYATMAELDQLITNFGYTAVNKNCLYTSLHCDPLISGDSAIIENMINTLGDTLDAFLDEIGDYYDISADGAGHVYGVLGTSRRSANQQDIAVILDNERIRRQDGFVYGDIRDHVETAFASLDAATSQVNLGSFLVAPSPVPLPAAAWLFGSALLGLGAIKRKKA